MRIENNINDNQDWHLQPKENTVPKKERGIPRWLFYTVVLIIAGILIVRGVINMAKPIEEKAYDMAVMMVEQDMSGSTVYFEDFDELYIMWLNDSKILVEVPVTYINQYGVEKTSVYEVSIEVEDGACYPGLAKRVVDEVEETEGN